MPLFNLGRQEQRQSSGWVTVQLRCDRSLSLYLAAPCRSLKRATVGIPILMYHSIQEPESTRASRYYETSTSPALFAEHVAYLNRNGYQAISLEQVQEKLKAGETCAKCVAITFDDGFKDFYVHADPVLEKHGFSATVFLPTAFIGTTAAWFNGKLCMTWTEVRELNSLGIVFGSHTVTHPTLRELAKSEIDYQLRCSKETIEQRLGTKVQSFAYPLAFPEADIHFRAMLTEKLNAAGYANGVCTTIGRAKAQRSHLFMKRLPVNSFDDLRLFGAKLAGAYDWVGVPQRWCKMAKDRLSDFKAVETGAH